MEGKHLILLTLCCLWLYVADARVISAAKSTKIRTVKIPACGCGNPVVDVPRCGCRGLGLDLPCDLNMRRSCACAKPVYVEPLEIPLCACGSGLPVAVYTIEMPCGCQSPESCTCGYKNSAILPNVYDFVEIPRCGCQSLAKPCGCQPINACGCQSSVKSCGCQTLNPCGCQGSMWMNYDSVSPYDVCPCRCNVPVTEIPCGCTDGNCGCCAMKIPTALDCLTAMLEPCGCVISAMPEVPVYSCGCQSTPCGCTSCIGCGGCGGCGGCAGCGGCGGCAGCGGVTLPPLPPVVGGTKYLRQVKLQPPFL